MPSLKTFASTAEKYQKLTLSNFNYQKARDKNVLKKKGIL